MFAQETSFNAPRRWLRFIQLDPFPAAWRALGLDDEDLRELELAILSGPDSHPVVRSTGGVRKMRHAPSRWHTGKSGACRVYYAHFPDPGLVLLVYAHAKAERENITAQQRNALRELMDEVNESLRRRPQPQGRKPER